MANNADVAVVILAAGQGTRMRSDCPKVLHQVGGKPMLQHVIDTASALDVGKIIVVVGHQAALIQQAIAAPVEWAYQQSQLGTAHALQQALPYLPETGRCLVLYGDVPLIDAATLDDFLSKTVGHIGLLTVQLENPTGYGRIKRQDGKIVGIVEEKDASEAEKAIDEVNTGMMVLPNHGLAARLAAIGSENAQKEFYLTDVIGQAQAAGEEVIGVAMADPVLASGVNTLWQLAEVERYFQNRQAHALTLAGVTLRDPERFDLRGTLAHGRDCVIDINVVMAGDCVLGNHVKIGAHCVLENVVLGDDVVIEPFSHLSHCVVEKHAKIGPFARLRPQAKIEESGRIGNFVEVKNATVGKGSKVNHLTYIGDAMIGQNSNIGAGCVTCNYDGVHKHRTNIGDFVRVGSGVMMVAPLTIGNYATIGAGSVLTKNCPPQALTLSRARQCSIERWQRPEKDDKAQTSCLNEHNEHPDNQSLIPKE